jgi:hypothetical protein
MNAVVAWWSGGGVEPPTFRFQGDRRLAPEPSWSILRQLASELASGLGRLRDLERQADEAWHRIGGQADLNRANNLESA